ncbi:MAG TPA: nucleotide exchange factor GrpE [Patescibacteria group bacterium]
MNKSDTSQLAEEQTDDRTTELEAQLKRVAADFDNFRRRTEEEKKDLYSLAQAATLLEIAPVMDNFRRATSHLPEHLQNDNWVTGVLYIEKQLEQIFEQFGVTKIKTVGETFDPRLHEALSTEPSDSVPANAIIAEFESGYMLKTTVLKPAKVKVSSGKNEAE